MLEGIDTLKGLVLPYTNFFIFLGLAFYFFRKPAIAAAKKRKEDYERLVKETRAALDQATAKYEDLKVRHAKLDAEANGILEISRETAAKEAARIVADAEKLAAHLKAEARRIADAEVEKARAVLRDEIVAQVKTGVAEKIKSELNQDSQVSLVRTNISRLQQIPVEHRG
jgi:F0F1-type ATP synthase membrane subunit b/b'